MIAVVPCSITEARRGVRLAHRHLPVPPPSGLAAWEARDTTRLAIEDPHGHRLMFARPAVVGWLILGRPSSRVLAAEGWVEVTRMALVERGNGAPSRLYSAAARWARARHRLIITYTMEGEDGASLLASGWVPVGLTQGGAWSCPARPNRADVQTSPTRRWVPRYCLRAALAKGWT